MESLRNRRYYTTQWDEIISRGFSFYIFTTEKEEQSRNLIPTIRTAFTFCVITFEPIEVQTYSAPQNDRQNLVFVNVIKVVVLKK